jgi:hypothetical protein
MFKSINDLISLGFSVLASSMALQCAISTPAASLLTRH